MSKKYFVVLSSLFLLMPLLANAEGEIRGWFEKRPEPGMDYPEWSYNKDVVITGENLIGKKDSKQLLPANRQLCLVSELNTNDTKCFASTDKLIKTWSPNNIIFSIPIDTFNRGTVKLRFERYEYVCKANPQFCDDVLKWGDDTTIENFQVRPVITGITLQGAPAPSIVPNSQYTIVGSYFGTGKGNVFVGDSQVAPENVLSWSPTEIAFNSTSLKGNTVRIQSGITTSENFVVKQGSSFEKSSSAQSSSATKLEIKKIKPRKTPPRESVTNSSSAKSVTKPTTVACEMKAKSCTCPRGYRAAKKSKTCSLMK